MNNAVKLFAKLKEVNYHATMTGELQPYTVEQLRNKELSSGKGCLLQIGNNKYGFSQWLSPKRTRTFPYARVYDTLNVKNRITLIPFCKDEGFDGDRDFIQWDTISLMSLLNVFVVIGYYTNALKSHRPGQINKNKITAQEYDYCYVAKQIMELEKYHSSPLHWNLAQIDKLHDIAKLTLHHYKNISRRTGVKLHGEEGIKKRIKILKGNATEFRTLSRELAKQAQHRENLTTQPKERVLDKKISISMANLLGGVYFMTADEGMQIEGKFYLIEKKHSARGILPSASDIKDSAIKMALFTNINKLELDGKLLRCQPMVGLSASGIKGFLHSNMSDDEIEKFLKINHIVKENNKTLRAFIGEARCNRFGVFVINSNNMEKQHEILAKSFA